MPKFFKIKLKEKLYNEINEFCELNSLNMDDYVNNILGKAFMDEKYGDAPFLSIKKIDDIENGNKKIIITEDSPKEIEKLVVKTEPIINDVYEDIPQTIETEVKPKKRKLK